MPNEGEIDCVFSGYVYGGKVIFPFVSGLYARSLDGSLESCRASMISRDRINNYFYHGDWERQRIQG